MIEGERRLNTDRRYQPLQLCAFALNYLLAFSSFLCADSPETRLGFTLETSDYLTEELSLPSLPEKLLSDKNAKVKASAEIINERGVITLKFPYPLEFKQKTECNSLFIEVNQDIDSPDLAHLQEKIGGLIKRFSNGYNNLYILAKKPVFYITETEDDHTLTIRILPDITAAPEATRLVKLAFARLLVEQRHYHEALSALSAILKEYPDDQDTLVLLSTLEGLLPQWQKQEHILAALSNDHPYNEDVQNLLDLSEPPHLPFASIERQMQRTETLAAVQVYAARAEAIVNASCNSLLYAGVDYQLWDGHVSSIINCQGVPAGFRGWRNRGAFYLRNEWNDGSILKGSLYDQESAFGGGLEYTLLIPQIQGSFRTDLEWHRPTWEIFECLAYNGRQDRLYAKIDSVYNRFFSWSFGGGAHRVGITGAPNGYASVLVSGQAFINMIIPNPVIGLGYSLDAEYVVARQSKINADGLPFFPVPYTSFENHTIKLYFIYIWRERLYISGYGGETYNRIGIKAPTFGGEISYIKPLPCSWEAKLAFDQFPSTIIQGATAQFLTATITVRF